MASRIRAIVTTRGRPGRLTVLALVAALAGLVVLAVAASAQQVAPEPPSSVIGSIPAPISADRSGTGDGPTTGPATTAPAPTATPIRKHSATTAGTNKAAQNRARSHKAKARPAPVLPASKPVHLSIPAIGVDTDLTTVGLTSKGAIDVPSGAQVNEAAWFDQSPTPGQDGPAVIVGHIDSIHGPSVFFRLGALRPGDTITVTRADGRVVAFTVDGLSQYPNREQLPIDTIYGGNLDRADLRLITCTNFDRAIRHYRGNTVVFAHLRSAHRP